MLPLLLISCGGGGGGGSSSSDNTQEDTQTETLTASFSTSSNSGELPFEVSVDASNSTLAESYSWDFGDGNSATGVTSTNTYTTKDNYTITLTVSDSAGAINSDSQVITVLNPTISGTINAPETSVADSDTSDPNVNVSNNTFDEAQLLPNPAMVGGHAQRSNDQSDVFRVDLFSGQSVNLTIANYQGPILGPNLDLYLYDENQNNIDSAVNSTASDTLTATQDGTYFVEVRAVTGQSNYTLNIGDAGISSQTHGASVSSSFMIGEAVFIPKQQDQITASATNLVQRAGKLAMPSGQFTSVSSSSISASDSILTLDAGKWSTEQQQKLDTLSWIAELNASGNYELVEPNFIHTASFTPNDQFFNLQWHYNSIQLEEALDIETGDSNVIVAVVDTGVLLNHPDLQNQVVNGYDFISNVSSALDGDGIDNNPDDPGDQSNSDGSSSFHGSHVAGTVAASTNNSIGVAGVAGGVRIMPLRVLGKSGIGTSYDIMQSLRFAAGLSNDSGTVPAQTADIINLSLGSTSFSQTEQDLYNQLEGLGIIVIAAAGNSNTSAPDYPASYDNVVSVSATNISNQRAYYSNFGGSVDVAAPGGALNTDTNGDGFPDGVLSTIADDPSSFTYSFFEGTSMASPHVAGVAALMKSTNVNIDADQFIALLQAGDITDDLGSTGRDNEFGYGIINARKAVIAAGGANNAPASVILSSNSMNFGNFNTSNTITVSDSSDGTLNINAITSSESWATATSNTTDGNNFGTYDISVDRTGLTDGTYSADITFDAISTSSTLNIQMQVATNPVTADAGYLYILAIDPDSRATIVSTEASSSNGQYTYTIEDIPPGDYEIVAGSDMNADNIICDPGESCGAYPTLDQNSIVTVNQSLTGYDFTVSFDSQITASFNATSETSEETFKGFQIAPKENTAPSVSQ